MSKIEPRFPPLVACFVLSGLAGLIYETVWTQQFALLRSLPAAEGVDEWRRELQERLRRPPRAMGRAQRTQD